MAKTTTGGASWTRVTPPLAVDLTTTSGAGGAPSHTHNVTIPNADFVAGLMDGQVLTVLEHKTVGDAEWLRVITQDGMEGWVFAKLVGPAR